MTLVRGRFRRPIHRNLCYRRLQRRMFRLRVVKSDSCETYEILGLDFFVDLWRLSAGPSVNAFGQFFCVMQNHPVGPIGNHFELRK